MPLISQRRKNHAPLPGVIWKEAKAGKVEFYGAFCMLALLAGCSGQENEIGDIDNYTPIALFDDLVVYNYIDESGALVIGNYDFSSKKYSDTASVEEFYISGGKPAVIDDSIILPITLNANEHKLLRVNTDSTTFEIIFNEFNPYPMDIVSTMNTDIYMLSTKKDDLATATYVRKYNENTGNMDICIEKQFTDIAGEQITAFACSNENIYVLTNNMEGENDVHIEIYDGKTYDLLVKLYFESELRDFVSDNGIVEFYCFDGYIYIRNFSDYGVIGKIENNQIKTVLELPNLRMAYNGKNTQDDYYGFFVRGGRQQSKVKRRKEEL